MWKKNYLYHQIIDISKKIAYLLCGKLVEIQRDDMKIKHLNTIIKYKLFTNFIP